MADSYNRTVVFPKGTGIHPYFILDSFIGLTGRHAYSYATALLLISVVIRLFLTPLTLKQYRGMAEMQRLQPHIKELNKKYEKDAAEKNKRMMALYKEHNVNPLGGCLPTLLQLPIYWGMYQLVVLNQYNFTHGTFLWIGSRLADMFPANHRP